MTRDAARQATQIEAAIAAAQAEAARAQATAPGAPAQAGQPSGIRITTAEGQTIVIDRDMIREAIAGTREPPPPPPLPRDLGPPDSIVAVIIVSILAATAVLFPVARALGRRINGKPAVSALQTSDVTMRLERIENAVESMAVEVERISEGQRFTTKLLSERPAEALLVPRGMSDAR